MMSSQDRAAEPASEYRQPVPFRAGVALSFADFRLTYIGDRRVTSPQFAPGFLYRDFRPESAHQVSQISWTSGTGDIAPLPFAVAGRQYRLELQFSESLGRLVPDTLVVSPAPKRR